MRCRVIAQHTNLLRLRFLLLGSLQVTCFGFGLLKPRTNIGVNVIDRSFIDAFS